jgi:hypothetical protein
MLICYINETEKIIHWSTVDIQTFPGEMIIILRGHSTGHSKQKIVYAHVSYFERFPR